MVCCSSSSGPSAAIEQDGALELVVSDPGQRTIILDARTLLSPSKALKPCTSLTGQQASALTGQQTRVDGFP
jgi:hypothetical protein